MKDQPIDKQELAAEAAFFLSAPEMYSAARVLVSAAAGFWLSGSKGVGGRKETVSASWTMDPIMEVEPTGLDWRFL
ncbi:MAG TPA: hypothetical protein DCS18_12950 [Alcanivorax sp.]|jgi:hypothetical protein|nr:hypothetical protein [Alcanivorax sp.]|tara:strand:+ start:8420 stop:8647 length:228 start_codon:yes stop_codon:yes gene_type:complete